MSTEQLLAAAAAAWKKREGYKGFRHQGSARYYQVAFGDGWNAAVAADSPSTPDSDPRVRRLVEAARAALEHTAELEDAWARGHIGEYDGHGGRRSNRNVSVDRALRAALAAFDPADGGNVQEAVPCCPHPEAAHIPPGKHGQPWPACVVPESPTEGGE